MSENGFLNPYAPHSMAPFASSVISTRAPISPLCSRRAALCRQKRGVTASPHCQIVTYTVGVRCLPKGARIHVGFPLIVPNPALAPFWSECSCTAVICFAAHQFLSLSCAFTTVDRIHVYSP